jgi:hypothetical protein
MKEDIKQQLDNLLKAHDTEKQQDSKQPPGENPIRRDFSRNLAKLR